MRLIFNSVRQFIQRHPIEVVECTLFLPLTVSAVLWKSTSDTKDIDKERTWKRILKKAALGICFSMSYLTIAWVLRKTFTNLASQHAPQINC